MRTEDSVRCRKYCVVSNNNTCYQYCDRNQMLLRYNTIWKIRLQYRFEKLLEYLSDIFEKTIIVGVEDSGKSFEFADADIVCAAFDLGIDATGQGTAE